MIINKTTGKRITDQEMICRTLLSQARGLMFRRKRNLLMILPRERRVSLHMFFVFYPLDILIINGQGRIVEIKQNLQPFALWRARQRGKYVVEIAYPSVYRVGDVVEMRDS